MAAASFLTTVRFLFNGRSPTLPMALLGVELRYTERGKPRRAMFDFMEQQVCEPQDGCLSEGFLFGGWGGRGVSVGGLGWKEQARGSAVRSWGGPGHGAVRTVQTARPS